MPNLTEVMPFSGCDVWQGDKLSASFHGVEARDRAKRWILAEEAKQKCPRISMRRVSKGR